MGWARQGDRRAKLAPLTATLHHSGCTAAAVAAHTWRTHRLHRTAPPLAVLPAPSLVKLQEAEGYFRELAVKARSYPEMAPNTVTYAALISGEGGGGGGGSKRPQLQLQLQGRGAPVSAGATLSQAF
jgi:hypothetical protein